MMKRSMLFAACLCMGVAICQDMSPPAELKQASWLLGTWSGTTTDMMGSPGAKPTAMKASIRAKMTIGGRYFEGVHSMNMGGQPFEGRHLMSYNPQLKKWVAFWFDAMAPEPMKMTGTITPSLASFVSEPTEMPGMEGPQVMRASWSKTGTKKIHFELAMKVEGKWQPVMTGDYKRP